MRRTVLCQPDPATPVAGGRGLADLPDAECPFLLANRSAGPPSLAAYPTARLVRDLMRTHDHGPMPLLLRVHGWSLDDVRRELRRREREGVGR